MWNDLNSFHLHPMNVVNTVQKQEQYRASDPCQSLQRHSVQAWPPTLYNSPHVYHLSQTELKTLA